MPEEDPENMKEATKKAVERKTVESTLDVCRTPSEPSGPVPVPYPNTVQSSDTSSGSKTVEIEKKKVMTEKSSLKKSTGDELGQSSWKSISKIIEIARVTKILKVPLWVWDLGIVVLLLAIWISVSNTPHPTESIEQYIIQLIVPAK